MHRIDPYSLWLGHAGDGRDARTLCEHGIDAVLQLAMEEPAPQLPREMLFFRIPILDGGDNEPCRLNLAIGVVTQLLRSGITTLVCCSAGASRSPAIAACALARLEARTPLECLKSVREQHATDVSPGLWNELLACESRTGSTQ